MAGLIFLRRRKWHKNVELLTNVIMVLSVLVLLQTYRESATRKALMKAHEEKRHQRKEEEEVKAICWRLLLN